MSDQTSDFGEPVVLVDRQPPGGGAAPVEHGIGALRDALDAQDATVETVDYWTEAESAADPCLVVGRADDQVVEKLLGESVTDPEAVVYRWADTGDGTALVVAGSDDRGLMYGLLELAERVEARGAGALSAVSDRTETPDNEVRGVDRFVEGPVEDEWLFDEAFWEDYLDRLARCRFNRFVLATGYDTAYFSPPYPFLVDVPDYPEVSVSDEIDVSREEHLAALRRIGELCHEHGLEFVFATWQQRPWSANPDIDHEPSDQGMLVEGLPEDDEAYTDYCVRGLQATLRECPEIDGLQLRVNFESGVGDRSTAESFWREIIDGVERAADERGRSVDLDLRAKGLTDDMIGWAQETGLNVTVPTKYWCESTGFPHHNTQMRQGELDNLDDMNRLRRYSYADMLEKPRFFDVLYRLWATGTNRVFLWGDPDYARRFGHSTQFGDGVGFEVTTPLSLKGGQYFLQDERWPLFDDPELRDYEYEDQRYWAWYRLFGRLGYSTDADPDVWEREYRARFGDAAPAVMRGLRAASKVLPLVTAAHLTRHPAIVNWAELDTGGALFAEHNFNEDFGDVTYASAEPSDPGLFYGIDEFVDDHLADSVENRYTPLQVSRWYEAFAADARAAAADAEDAIEVSTDDPTGELAATLLDVRMLADLGEYHALKTRAATALCLHERTDAGDAGDEVDAGDGVDETAELAAATAYMSRATEAWRSLAERGEGTYHDDLVFAMGPDAADEGNWADRLVEMEADLAELDRRCEAADLDPGAVDSGETDDSAVADDSGSVVPDLVATESPPFAFPTVDLDVPDAAPAGEPVDVRVRTGEMNGFDSMTLYYRHANQAEGPFRSASMDAVDDGFAATIPADYVSAEWDLLVYVGTRDESGNTVLYPGLYHAEYSEPYRVVETR